jgi:glutamine amidotransferase
MLIGLLDYGAGNLGSIKSALKQIDIEFIDIKGAEEISKVDSLVIPGVGSFSAGMQNLSKNGISESVTRYAKSGNQVLGICLGMHLLGTYGEEGGGAAGLGLISGEIRKLEKSKSERVPHVGWDLITNVENNDKNFAYFAHSYYFEIKGNEKCHVPFTFNWEDKPLPAVIRKDNIFGIQFHPEKSHTYGLKMLSKILKVK